MFESTIRRSFGSRVFGTLLSLAVPLFFLIRLVWPRGSVVYVSWDPFSVESNTIQSRLPPLLKEVVYSYPNTLLAIALLLIAVRPWRWSRSRRASKSSVWLPVFFLPTYVFGIEATRHVTGVGRRHYWSGVAPDLRSEVSGAMTASLLMLLGTLIAGSIAAAIMGRRKSEGGAAASIPPVVLAIVLAVAGDWYVFWAICQPIR